MRSEPATPELVEIRRLHAVIKEMKDILRERGERLDNGRKYLMSVEPDEITVENTFVAFGWDKNGQGAQPT